MSESKIWVIPVTWQQQGQFVVRAKTLEQALEFVENNEHCNAHNANGEYVDSSFEVVKDCITEISEEDRKKIYADDTYVEVTENDVPE